jgi:hypothetical protein
VVRSWPDDLGLAPLARVRATIRDMGGRPSTAAVDRLLDERLDVGVNAASNEPPRGSRRPQASGWHQVRDEAPKPPGYGDAHLHGSVFIEIADIGSSWPVRARAPSAARG